MVFTHRASRIAGGRTISHCPHHYKDLQYEWAVVDAFSQIGLELLRQVARWHLVGWKFIFVGVPRGQLLPFADRWIDAPTLELEHSCLMSWLTNLLKIEMQIYRRGTDPSLFHFYTSIWSSTEPIAAWVDNASDRYHDHDGDAIDHAIFLSDLNRWRWNAYMNRELASRRRISSKLDDIVRVECEKGQGRYPERLSSVDRASTGHGTLGRCGISGLHTEKVKAKS